MIDRIRLSAAAKNQLANLKRRTGIEHYNTLCRHALCISLANPTVPPKESINFNGGIELDWRVFTSGQEVLYWNLIIVRAVEDAQELGEESLRQVLAAHIHRGLSYMASKSDEDLFSGLA
ncbi:DNA sulfur modification protein DndE [Silvimonas iriomotensis]|uniref:DNA sulfur modification protein DndE n=1 Tax=Silvimonas iriomotensis TaxID=449662 RepID=A0ABQ2PF12_9NEIS|nr:DNA sulfur modification protein DndE [Silvimonas iriomotensis]GGP23789.1 hypothetical protein GCM10010970_37890 [Silvimonas iriomotensis]